MNHGGGGYYRRYYSTPSQSISWQRKEELSQQLKKQARDEAVNVILKKVEASTVVHSPHIAAIVEVARQSYNHRDYLYAVAKELASDSSTKEKFSNIRDLTIQEIKKETVSRLESGGTSAVSSYLKVLGVFEQPFGTKGRRLNDQQSDTLQKFFERTLNQIAEG